MLACVRAGKTTFIRMLAGLLKADPDADGKEPELEGFSVWITSVSILFILEAFSA